MPIIEPILITEPDLRSAIDLPNSEVILNSAEALTRRLLS